MLFVASSNRGMQRLGLLLVLCLYCAEACSQDCAAGAYLSNCTCQLCSAGSYSAQRNNASSCTSCADSAWKTSDAGSTACTVCAKPFTPAVVRMTSDYNFDAIPGVDVVFQLPAVPLQTVYGGWYMRVEIWHGIWLHFHGLHLTVVDYDVSVLPSGAIVNSVTYNTQSTFQGDGYVYERGTRTLTVSKRLRIDVLSQQHYVYNLSFVPNGDCVHCTDVSEIDLNGDLMRPLYANTHCIPPPHLLRDLRPWMTCTSSVGFTLWLCCLPTSLQRCSSFSKTLLFTWGLWHGAIQNTAHTLSLFSSPTAAVIQCLWTPR